MNKTAFRIGPFLVSVVGSVLFSGSVCAQAIQHQTDFSVKYNGLEIGKLRFEIRYDKGTYNLRGTGQTTGLVEWLVPSTVEIESSGAVIDRQLKPQLHSVSIVEDRKEPEIVELAFDDARVSDVNFRSADKKKARIAPKYVPIEASHRSGVVDPASTLIIPVFIDDATNGNKVCNQRFAVFDGNSRYDIRLRFKHVRPVKTGGYHGNAYVCQMRYIPVAGHRRNHRPVQEMAVNKRMEVWLAPMARQSVFTPIKIYVGTKYGSFVANPVYFGAVQ